MRTNTRGPDRRRLDDYTLPQPSKFSESQSPRATLCALCASRVECGRGRGCAPVGCRLSVAVQDLTGLMTTNICLFFDYHFDKL